MHFQRISSALIAIAVLLSAGCDHLHVDKYGVPSVHHHHGNGGGSASAGYQVLNLASGEIVIADELPDLLSDSAYRTTKMVFRQTTATDGSAFLLGVFEVTQAQWQVIAGSASQPWTRVATVPTGALGSANSDDPTKPAFALSYDAIAGHAGVDDGALTSYRATHASIVLALPSTAQWRGAAGTATFAWGEGRYNGTNYAWVRETCDGVRGFRSVGTTSADGNGFYDLHGNVREWTSERTLLGGSWMDNAMVSASANAITNVDRETEHALSGVRLVLIP